MTRVFFSNLRTLVRGTILVLGTHTFLGPFWLVFLHGFLFRTPLDDVLIDNLKGDA